MSDNENPEAAIDGVTGGGSKVEPEDIDNPIPPGTETEDKGNDGTKTPFVNTNITRSADDNEASTSNPYGGEPTSLIKMDDLKSFFDQRFTESIAPLADSVNYIAGLVQSLQQGLQNPPQQLPAGSRPTGATNVSVAPTPTTTTAPATSVDPALVKARQQGNNGAVPKGTRSAQMNPTPNTPAIPGLNGGDNRLAGNSYARVTESNQMNPCDWDHLMGHSVEQLQSMIKKAKKGNQLTVNDTAMTDKEKKMFLSFWYQEINGQLRPEDQAEYLMLMRKASVVSQFDDHTNTKAQLQKTKDKLQEKDELITQQKRDLKKSLQKLRKLKNRNKRKADDQYFTADDGSDSSTSDDNGPYRDQPVNNQRGLHVGGQELVGANDCDDNGEKRNDTFAKIFEGGRNRGHNAFRALNVIPFPLTEDEEEDRTRRRSPGHNCRKELNNFLDRGNKNPHTGKPQRQKFHRILQEIASLAESYHLSSAAILELIYHSVDAEASEYFTNLFRGNTSIRSIWYISQVRFRSAITYKQARTLIRELEHDPSGNSIEVLFQKIMSAVMTIAEHSNPNDLSGVASSTMHIVQGIMFNHLPAYQYDNILQQFDKNNDDNVMDNDSQLQMLLTVAQDELGVNFQFRPSANTRGHNISNIGRNNQNTGSYPSRGQHNRYGHNQSHGDHRLARSDQQNVWRGNQQVYHETQYQQQPAPAPIMRNNAPVIPVMNNQVAMPPPMVMQQHNFNPAPLVGQQQQQYGQPMPVQNQVQQRPAQQQARPVYQHEVVVEAQPEPETVSKPVKGLQTHSAQVRLMDNRTITLLAKRFPNRCLKCGSQDSHFARECPLYPDNIPEAQCSQCGWYHQGPCKGPQA